MPSIKELEQFRNELRGIGNEPEITEQWGEKYEELPLPTEVPAPEIDVDNLLDSINFESENQNEIDEQEILEEPSSGEDDRSFNDTEIIPDISDLFDNDSEQAADDLGISEPALELFEEEDSGNNSDGEIVSPLGTFEMPAPDTAVIDTADTEMLEMPSFDLTDMGFPSGGAAEPYEDVFFDEESSDSIPSGTATEDTADIFDFDFNEEEPQAESSNLEDKSEIDSLMQFDDEPMPLEEISLFEEPADDPLENGNTEETQLSEAKEESSFSQMLDELDFNNLPELDGFNENSGSSSTEAEAESNSTNVEEVLDSSNDFSDLMNFPELDNASITEDTAPQELTDALTFDEDLPVYSEGHEDIPPADDINIEDFHFDPEDISASDISFDDIPAEEDKNTAIKEYFDIDIPKPSQDSVYTPETPSTEEKGSINSAEENSDMNVSDIDMSEIDNHTGFSLDDDVLNKNIDENLEDFTIPDDFSSFSSSSDSKSYEKETSVEDDSDKDLPLSITSSEYQTLINRIASFPLNVRLEIQDYLANNDDSENSKMELVHLIIKNTSLKKIVAKLESVLEKTIPIPKGFVRKSVEEYEKEKRSFKYRFVHKILPAATIFGLVLLLVSCLGILSWHFIYKPVVSEKLYKQGFSQIGSGEYSASIQSFDEAGSYKKKYKWYFRYAHEFRDKKQFSSAEAIYLRLLTDFRNDKRGGIEFAHMLSSDLRNYGKAETVLRRRVLDHHINDEEALLALGDLYLDWADDDSSKFEKSKEVYNSLINLYGLKDIFAGRMLKYFIRTDNLAEVLPLKDYFMNSRSKLPPEAMIELSGYLLEKRYEPKLSDSDELRAKIGDVRELLEKALKAAKANPDAKYNLGRFYVYNRNPQKARIFLHDAIGLYEDSSGMTSRRILKQLDAIRLLGEIFAQNSEYLDAQKTYADGLSKYRDYSIQKLLPPNEKIGRLYANYADISYFISGDMNSALNAYSEAVRELYNTPSIQYRIGYIQYQKGNYADAMRAMTLAYAEKPNDKNLLYGFGNVLYKRGNYFASQAYYERLMELLDAERMRKGMVFPHLNEDHAAFAEKYMEAANNLGVVLNKQAMQSGNSDKNARALALFSESIRAWDALTRNPDTMIRSKSVNLGYLNIQNMTKPRTSFEPEIYSDIPMTLENEHILQRTANK